MRVSIIGYGKMGHLIEEVALLRGHEINCVIDKDSGRTDAFESDIFKESDVVFEFTEPSVARENILKCWKYNIPVICGTTGWDDTELVNMDNDRVKRGYKSLLVHKSNFSVGVDIVLKTCGFIDNLLRPYPDYRSSIVEVHHKDKKDVPSGTALSLKKILGSDVSVSSIREGDAVGTHTVSWESEDDIIQLTHIAKDRKIFALGAVLEAEKLFSHG